MVETPKDKDLWALDTVTMNQAQEFSQQHIGEQIITHRIVSEKTALELCNQDNSYAQAWSNTKKIDAFFTTIKDQDEH
jgi:5'-deoxynucleotidase YfbR-like HD superfamily hydrolase